MPIPLDQLRSALFPSTQCRSNRRKTNCARLALILASTVGLWAGNASGQIWDYEYLGTAMLNSPWQPFQPGEMETDPPNTWVQINGGPADPFIRMSSSEWAPGASMTVEFSLNIVTPGEVGKWAQGIYILAGENLSWQLLIDVNRVTLFGASTTAYNGTIGQNVSNVYRLVVTDGVADLYFNNNPTPLIANITGSNADPTFTQIDLGDYGGSPSGDGQWNYIRWNNTQAIAVPEASTMSLAGVALLLGAAVFVRRKKACQARSC